MRKLFFALCIILLTLIACNNPYDLPNQFDPPPPGLGSFSLSLNTARNIIPQTPALTAFTVFELAFTSVSGTPQTTTVDRNNDASLSEPVIMAPGTYNLVVTAFLGPGKTRAAARGNLDNIVITEGVNTSRTVDLKMFTGGEQGTFRWNLTLPAGLEEARIRITPLDGTAEQTQTLSSGVTTWNDSVLLNSGYYRVTIILVRPGAPGTSDEVQPFVHREALHVYQNMESVYTENFASIDFNRLRYTVTFDYNDGVTSPTTVDVLAGVATSGPIGPPPTRDGYFFFAWYSDAAFNYLWNFATEITEPVTLYARWCTVSIRVNEDDTNINYFITLAEAIEWLHAVEAGTYEVEIAAGNGTPHNIEPTTFDQTPGGGKRISLTSFDPLEPVSVQLSANGTMFTLSNSITLTLGNGITLIGRSGNDASVVQVENGGTFNMNGGEISGNRKTISGNMDGGGGVFVNGGTFNMNGGTISDNRSVGGGFIDGNFVDGGGGGVFVNGGTFTMNNGTISGNLANINSVGGGGGVFVFSGTFTMSGGTISENSTWENGGGVLIGEGSGGATFIMTGGEISGNTAIGGGGGGGVYVTWSNIFTMSDGTISNNTAADGGGVSVRGGTFTMNSGTISGNTVFLNGGGVYVAGTFTMSDGTISDNTADYGGGGVCLWGGTFTMNGGTISGNEVGLFGGSGGGVSIIDEGSFIVGGTAVISGNTRTDDSSNNNVCLTDELFGDVSYITLGTGANAPAAGMEIWVNTETPNGVIVNTGASAVHVGFFHADDPAMQVVYRADNGGQLVLVQAGSADAPFLIHDETDLRRVGRGAENPAGFTNWTLSAHYRLMADIILTQDEWTRIGDNPALPNNPDEFTGTFDGNGKIITGLEIDKVGNEAQGMFGIIGTGGVVRNLGLVDVNIAGHVHVGGVAGYSEVGGTIENCYVTGTVSGFSAVGGLIGMNNGIVRNSYATAAVDGNTFVGGLLGQNYDTIENSYSTGNITGEAIVGGAAGLNEGTMRNTYATGIVTGDDVIGGVAGGQYGDIMQNNIALNPAIVRSAGDETTFGRVTGFAGTLPGNNYARSDMVFINISPTVTPNTNGLHGADVSVTTPSGGYHSLSFWQTTMGWDFTTTWEWNADTNLPILRNMPAGTQNPQVTPNPSLGFTFEVEPIQGHTPEITSGLVLSRATNPTGSLTITNAGYSSIEWFFGPTFELLGTGATLPLNLSTLSINQAYNVIGVQTIHVIVMLDGVPYSANVSFEVTP
jgi:uncharacterized repeat protein (TIGR02543 family)